MAMLLLTESYENHASVLKIKSKFGSDLSSFDFQQIKAPEVKTFLRYYRSSHPEVFPGKGLLKI